MVLLLGNEAIARGVMESGVGVVSTYPGTPSSEIGDVLYQCAPKAGFYMEYSTNEKVAMEVAGSAALAGVRSFTCMKHVGLNVAIDAFMCLAYVGVDAGLVVVTADDVGPWSSQNEQDNRYYSLLSGTPMLEPSSPQEAKDMIVEAFKISEKLNEPVLVRTTTRVNHTRGNVRLGSLKKPKVTGKFERQSDRFLLVPAVAKARHKILLSRMEDAKEFSEKTDLNFVDGEGELGIVTSGVSYNYVKEAMNELNLNAAILKLGMTHPLPEEKVSNFLSAHAKVIVVEELEPYIENYLRATTSKTNVKVKILGKQEGLFPRFGEFDPRNVLTGIAQATEKKIPLNLSKLDQDFESVRHLLPKRPPILCPGCPHRATFYAIRVATGGKAIYPNDIGCYGLAAMPPLETHTVFCMGSGVGLSCGLSVFVDQPIVATIGDSTFFHAGIPALINAIYNQHKFVYTILDNETTAMTGHQPHPGTGVTNRGVTTRVMIEEVAKGCGAKFVRVVDPFKVKETIKTFREALEYDGLAVVVARRKCILLTLRERRRKGVQITPYEVDSDKCTECEVCTSMLGCPAISWVENKAAIEPTLCVGIDCGVCAQICPYDAIRVASA